MFTEVLEENFNMPVYDVIEDYTRPCFMTELVSLESERFMTTHIDNYLSMKIYFFPTTVENNAAEISLMKDEIIDLFFLKLDSLIPTRVPLEITDLNFDDIKDVLRISVDFNVSHRVNNTHKGKSEMGELNLGIKYHEKYEIGSGLNE